MEEILKRHEINIQELKGWQLEHKVFINICSYLGSYIGIRKCKIKDKSELLEELDEYVEIGKEISNKLKSKLKKLNVEFVLVKD